MHVILERSPRHWQSALIPKDTPLELLCEYSQGDITGQLFEVPDDTPVHICLGDFSGLVHKYMDELLDRGFSTIQTIYLLGKLKDLGA